MMKTAMRLAQYLLVVGLRTGFGIQPIKGENQARRHQLLVR
jgi:hypothetical protein